MQVMATLLAVVGLVFLGVAPGFAATLTVNTTNDFVTAGDGACSLREAVIAVDAPPGNGECGPADTTANTIVLGAAHYALFKAPTGADDVQTGDLNVAGPTTSLAIVGAGPGATLIDAQSLGDRVLQIGSTAPAVTVAQLTITGAHALPGQDGGAIDNAGTLVLFGDTLTANHAGDGVAGVVSGVNPGPGGDGGAGGAVHNTGALAVSTTTISSNAGGTGGVGTNGGLNTTPFGTGVGGTGGAGAIANEGGTATVTSSTIVANHAGPGGAGGAGGNIVVGIGQSDGLPGGNGGAGGNGGGIAAAAGAVTVTNSTVVGNTAGDGGSGGLAGPGGISPPGSNGGAAGDGGGVFLFGGTLSLVHVTVSANTVGVPGPAGAGAVTSPGAAGFPGFGGGFSSFIPLGSTIRNSIVAGNPGTDCSGPPAIDAGHNLTGLAAGCPGVKTDPLLGPLQDNGGPTLTMALGAGSPAIDQVPALGAGCLTTDQRGVPRPQFAACDIGAYEVAEPPPLIPITGPPEQPPGGGLVVLPPVLSQLKLSPSRFRAASKGSSTAPSAKHPKTGTTISYRDSQAAITTLTIERSSLGIRRATSKTCKRRHGKGPKGAKTCTLVTTLGHVTHRDRVGSNSVHFSGRLSTRTKLTRGAYRLVLSAQGTAPAKSQPLTGRFTITG